MGADNATDRLQPRVLAPGEAEQRRVAEVARFFDSFAEEFDQAYQSGSAGGRTLRRRLDAVLEQLGAGPGDVLDAGMGGGVVCAELERMGWSVSGVDISPRMVALAWQRLPHLRERLLRGSIGALPFDDASFDAAVVMGVLEYVEDQLPQALSEVARVLRPRGKALLTLPNYASIQTGVRFRLLYPSVRALKRALRRPVPPARRPVSFAELEDAVTAAGLRVENVQLVGVRPLPAGAAERVERRASRALRLLGTQYVLLARRLET